MTIDLLVPKEVFTTHVPKFSLQYNSAAVNEVELYLEKILFPLEYPLVCVGFFGVICSNLNSS